MVLFLGDFGAKKIRHTRNALYLIKLFVRPLFTQHAQTRYHIQMILDFTKSGDKPTAKAITLACVF